MSKGMVLIDRFIGFFHSNQCNDGSQRVHSRMNGFNIIVTDPIIIPTTSLIITRLILDITESSSLTMFDFRLFFLHH